MIKLTKETIFKILILSIFLLALFLRVYQLNKYSVGFLWDEAALGYNAYSILKTGRDEYGVWFPLIFKSFGDYKPGFYIYLTVPSVAIFGLNEFSVRLPSAIFGGLTVLFLYFLLRRNSSDKLALLAAALLMINPWHLSFSRGAWELNLMTFEIVFGLWLAVKAIKSKSRYFYFSVLFFILALFTYQSAKLLAPALILGFAFFYRRELKTVPSQPKIIFGVSFLLVFLFFNFLTVAGGRAGRLKVMSILSYSRPKEERLEIQAQDNGSTLDWLVFHESPIFFARSILGRYFNHFSGKFLFFSGDWSNLRNGVAYHGLFYFIDLIFLVWGLGFILGKKRSPLENFMLFWLLLAPLPSAVTRDSVSSVRSFTMVIPLVFIIAAGMESCLSFFATKNKYFKTGGYLFLIVSYLFLFCRLVDYYFVHDPIYSAKDRLFGYKEAVRTISEEGREKDKIVMTVKYGQPYIFYLFYTQYDPAQYQKQAHLVENVNGDVGNVEKIDNLEFRDIYWPSDRGIKNSLFVGDEFSLPIGDLLGRENQFAIAREIKYPNGDLVFRIVETN